jgi:hypothetical protein
VNVKKNEIIPYKNKKKKSAAWLRELEDKQLGDCTQNPV